MAWWPFSRPILLPKAKTLPNDNKNRPIYDIFDDYWEHFFTVNTWSKIYDALEDHQAYDLRDLRDLSLITEGQRVFLSVSRLHAEIMNGGFEQYLWNVGYLTDDLIDCLKIAGLQALASDVEDAWNALKAAHAQIKFEDHEIDNYGPGSPGFDWTQSYNAIAAKSAALFRLDNEFASERDCHTRQLVEDQGGYELDLLKALVAYADANMGQFVEQT